MKIDDKYIYITNINKDKKFKNKIYKNQMNKKKINEENKGRIIDEYR